MTASPKHTADSGGLRAFWPEIQRRLEEVEINAKIVGGYLNPYDLSELVSCIRTQYRICERVEIVEGAGQGVFAALVCCRDFAERLYLPRIGFPGYRVFAQVLGYQVTFYDPNTLTSDSIDAVNLLGSRSVVLVSQPHNPTGRRYSSAAIQQLVRECAGPRAALILDFGADFCGEVLSNKWTLDNIDVECCVRVASLGKLLGCPGLRLGFVWSRDRRLLAEISKFKIHINRSPCPLAATVAVKLLDSHEYMHEVALACMEISNRRTWLFDTISSASIKVVHPDTGCFVYTEDGGTFNRQGIIGVRGSIFGDNSDNNIRLTTALHETTWQAQKDDICNIVRTAMNS